MSCENIFKDICHIHARLFDHRSASQGHINFFAKEFEEKRGDRENMRLNHIQETVMQTASYTLPTIHSQCAAHLALVNQRIQEATKQCQHVAEQERAAQEESDFLKLQRTAREHAMSEFMEQQCAKSARVDQQHADNVRLVTATYEELRQQLRQGTPLSSQAYHRFMALGKEVS